MGALRMLDRFSKGTSHIAGAHLPDNILGGTGTQCEKCASRVQSIGLSKPAFAPSDSVCAPVCSPRMQWVGMTYHLSL